MNKYLIAGFIIFSFVFPNSPVYGQDDYLVYHNDVIRCEQLIVARKFGEAIDCFDSLFHKFDFVFLKDCKVATELSAFENDLKSGFRFLRLGILNGWNLKSIEKEDNLSMFRDDPHWKVLQSEYDSLHSQYLGRLNLPLRDKVHEMFKNDQKKALRALFRIGQKSRERMQRKNLRHIVKSK